MHDQALLPLVKCLLEEWPGWSVYLSGMMDEDISREQGLEFKKHPFWKFNGLGCRG